MCGANITPEGSEDKSKKTEPILLSESVEAQLFRGEWLAPIFSHDLSELHNLWTYQITLPKNRPTKNVGWFLSQPHCTYASICNTLCCVLFFSDILNPMWFKIIYFTKLN